jgi:hypothetical protein
VLLSYLENLLALLEDWLIYNVHGLGEEVWRLLRSEYLTRTSVRLVRISDLKILPAREALALAK